MNNIYIRRKNKVVIHGKKCDTITSDSCAKVATILKNIDSLGYAFSKEVINKLLELDEKSLVSFYKEVIPILKDIVGADKKYTPMYPNFPKQVMDASEAELYINAMMHYLGSFIGINILPDYEIEDRTPLTEKCNKKVISLGSEKDFKDMIKNIISSKTSISSTDYSDIETIINDVYKNSKESITYSEFLPDQIFHKEILAKVVALIIKNDANSYNDICKYFNTATDVLRLATALSSGDISLTENSKFSNFSRPVRRLILGLLNNCNNIEEDMVRHQRKWLRLGEVLHPMEKSNGKRFKSAAEAFYKIRNNIHIDTFNSKIEKYSLDNNTNFYSIIDLLKNRPGEFARKLDKLLRDNPHNVKYVLKEFNDVVDKVATPVLLQVISHFRNNLKKDYIRAILPKGNSCNLLILPDNEKSKGISKTTVNNLIKLCDKSLIKRFSSLESLGKVYINPMLKNYIVPFSQRSSSKVVKTLVRGSRVSLRTGENKDKNTIRFYIWWKNNNSRIDIDLSAVGYDENLNKVLDISYYNLRSENIGCHSGDIVDAPNGACEFIDLDIQKLKERNIRYIVANVNSFTRQTFSSINECFVGYMLRDNPSSGQIYDAATLENKISISSNSRSTVPMIIDIETDEVIWVDCNIEKSLERSYNNAANNNYDIKQILKVFLDSVNTKYNLYDLFMLHAKARGSIVDCKEEANTIFSVEEGITPFDIEKIISEFL